MFWVTGRSTAERNASIRINNSSVCLYYSLSDDMNYISACLIFLLLLIEVEGCMTNIHKSDK